MADLTRIDRMLKEFLALPPGWNSYNAAPVDVRAADHIREIVRQAFSPDTPDPSIVPLSSGGLQMEWHLKTVEAEICVDNDGATDVWYHEYGGPEYDATDPGDLSIVKGAVSRLVATEHV